MRTRQVPIEADATIIESSGNVFADLGYPNPDLALAKAALMTDIELLIDGRGLTKTQAADLLGITQAEVSYLVRGHQRYFSLDRLLHLLNRLSANVAINVTHGEDREPGRTTVTTPAIS